jgi:hypothetical protein
MLNLVGIEKYRLVYQQLLLFCNVFDFIDKTLGAYKNNSSNPLSSTVVDER